MPDRSGFPARLTQLKQQRGEAITGRVRYDIWATRSIEELYKLMLVVRGRLDQVTAPCLLIYSQNDPTVPIDNLEFAQKHLTHTQVETHSLTNSGHIITQDEEHEELFERVARFILDHAGDSST
jgi:esterase/lipase